MAALAGRIAERAGATPATSPPARPANPRISVDPPPPPTRSTPTDPDRRLVVIGGGVAGLSAAYWAATHQYGTHVTLIEATGEVGGKVRTSTFEGRPVDEAADAFLARDTEAEEVWGGLQLSGDQVTPADGRAYLFTGGALRRFPEGGVLGVPTDLDALAASGIVDEAAVEAARRDLTDPGRPLDGDEAVGPLPPPPPG